MAIVAEQHFFANLFQDNWVGMSIKREVPEHERRSAEEDYFDSGQ